MGNLSSFLARKLQWVIIFLFAVFMAGTLGNCGQAYAGGSTFDIPEINDHFDQVTKPEPQKPAPAAQPVKEESGLWDQIAKPVSEVWKWTRDKASAVWNRTKDTASAFWDGVEDIISKIAEVTVDALTDAWDWIQKHETLGLVVLTILGIATVIFGGGFVSAVGIGILGGEILGGIVSWFSGNEFMSEAMLEDMLIWGFASGIAAIIFEWVATSVAGAPLVAAIAGKVPWLGKALPKMFGSAAMAGTDQSIIDFLKGQFSWKKTAITAGVAFVLVFGGKYVGNHSDDIIKWINHINISPVTQYFADGTSSAPKLIGDTPLGQWLQKFASKNGESGTTIGNSTVRITVQFAEGFDDHLIKGNGIGKGKQGVIGAHNMKEFTRTLKNTGVDIHDLIISKKQSSKFPGLYNIEYRVPSLTYDKSGNLVPSGQYKVIRNPKTVYDPEIYSDQQIIQWGKEAMQEGINAGRVKDGKFVEGYSSNGIKFGGYLDNGKIKNFYPVIEEDLLNAQP